jgi:peptide/nickel transport system substrate-binding protein
VYVKRKVFASVAVATVMTLAAAACSSGSGGSSAKGGTPTQGGTATYAFNAGEGANYIFPLESGEFATQSNAADFYQLLWRPLYWFGANGNSQLNTSLSLADPPQFSADGKTVTIKLKPYVWSDGTAVTTRDITFWDNLVTANKKNYSSYTPGNYPDNLVGTKVVSPTEIQLTFNKAYNQQWLLYNELSQIVPLPQQAWDRTSQTGKVGNYDESTSGAVAVYNFLDGLSKKLSTYAKNPIWQTVDGPWRLTAFDTNGNFTMVPNPKYSGPVKPHLAEFKEQSYTDTSAEFNALESGQGPDYGYISNIQQPRQPVLNRLGYREVNEYDFVIDYNAINFNNPTLGPVFKQLYIRQVLQELTNQGGIDTNYYDGDAYPSCGPIPPEPNNSFIDSYVKSCPIRYDPAKAAATLRAHGWSVVKNGVDTCQSPGTGPSNCGANIPMGQKLEIPYIYPTGSIVFPKTVAQEASDADAVGVKYDLKALPYNEANSQTVSCTPSQPVCKWGISAYGWIYSPDFYPSGESLFETGAGDNPGNYSDPKADALINATTLKTSETPQQALDKYQDYLAQQIPVVWQPNTFVLDEIRSKLQGTTPINVFGNITPENWYFTK